MNRFGVPERPPPADRHHLVDGELGRRRVLAARLLVGRLELAERVAAVGGEVAADPLHPHLIGRPHHSLAHVLPTSHALTSYAGLVPSTHSSGGKTYHGKVGASGNSWLKWAVVEATHVLKRAGPGAVSL